MPKKRKIGRPKVITPAIEKRLLKFIAGGKTLHEACRAAGISYDALVDKRLADDAFSVRSARATLIGCESALSLTETRLKKSTNKRISVDRELAHHYRWKASKLLSAYKDKIGVDLAVEPSELPDIEAARRIAFALELAGRQLQDRGSKPAPALLPAPPKIPIYREVDKRAERRIIEGAAERVPDEAPHHLNTAEQGVKLK